MRLAESREKDTTADRSRRKVVHQEKWNAHIEVCCERRIPIVLVFEEESRPLQCANFIRAESDTYDCCMVVTVKKKNVFHRLRMFLEEQQK